MARKAKTAVSVEDTGKSPKAKRQTTASLRKEIDALKETNNKLLNEIGNLSAMYMNALNENKKAEKNGLKNYEREAVVMATKRIVAFLMQTYGISIHDIVK